MLVDDITLHFKAGDGGNGVVRWLHEKGKEFGGPAGGNGGNGGDVLVRAVRDMNVLNKYKSVKSFAAERGEDGRSRSQFGKNGKDLIIDLPMGSLVTNLETGKIVELLREGEIVKVLSGGRGGLGNEHFKASTNVRPKQWTAGKEGEEANFHVELRLIADAGLIGFPNAGKSSLLNALTNASAKVGAYKFTTLEPNLGAFYGYILADIPGLIEGASTGKGLGHKFLRHIERTKVLLHCISLENEDVEAAYETIRTELESYAPELLKKTEAIVLTKSDVTTPDMVAKIVKKMKKKSKFVYSVSVIDDASLKEFSDNLTKLLRAHESDKS